VLFRSTESFSEHALAADEYAEGARIDLLRARLLWFVFLVGGVKQSRAG
jgi:hypothetical protein